MNPYTGHLIALDDNEKPPEAYEALPAELLSAARQELAGRTEAHVNLHSRSNPLAVWAKKKRLAKIAAKSRQRNRK